MDANMEGDARNAANYWRQEHIVNVTIILAACNLAFRGHSPTCPLEAQQWELSQYNTNLFYFPLLKELVERQQGSVKYLSPALSRPNNESPCFSCWLFVLCLSTYSVSHLHVDLSV